MTHVVIPAAGGGRRFVEAGYPPKPWVPVGGVPMLRRVVDNLRPAGPHRVTVVVAATPPDLGPGVHVVTLDAPTGGAVQTILAAGIGDGPLLVANCDQLLGYPVDLLCGSAGDAAVATFTASSPAHSYVRVDADGYVAQIAEKRVISSRAVAGVYWFRRGQDFAEACRRVVKDDRRVLGEYYVSTVLGEMVAAGTLISVVHGPAATLGTPEELAVYEAGG